MPKPKIKFDNRLKGMIFWVASCIAFLILKPQPFTPSFWMFLAITFTAAVFYMFLEHSENIRNKNDYVKWHQEIDNLIDKKDFDDDGHLYELLDPKERQQIVEELKKMQVGSRSLKRSIKIVCPDLYNE